MATTSKGRAQDRAKVAGRQDDEVLYEADKTNVSKDAVKEVVKSAGNFRKTIEAQLGK